PPRAAGGLRPRDVRRGGAGAAHARLLPLRRARLPGGGVVLRLRWRRMPGLREGVARASRRRNGPPEGARELRDRLRAVHGVRVRHGDRARRDGQVRRQRHAAVRRGGRSLPRTVRGRGVKVVLSWLRELCPTERSAEDLAELLTGKGAE